MRDEKAHITDGNFLGQLRSSLEMKFVRGRRAGRKIVFKPKTYSGHAYWWVSAQDKVASRCAHSPI